MRSKSNYSRRRFVVSNLAVAASAAAAGQAVAMGCGKGHAVAPKQPASWATATAEHLEPLLGHRFRLFSEETGDVVLKLTQVIPGNSGPHRPKHLAREESVIAVFSGPDSDAVFACGAQNYRVKHPQLGSADLYASPTCLETGEHVIDIILG